MTGSNGTAAHIPDDVLVKYSSESLDREHTHQIRSHILECRDCQARLMEHVLARLSRLSPESANLERRSEERGVVSSGAILQELSPLSFEHVAVEIVDTSGRGFAFFGPRSVQPGTVVCLREGHKDWIGMVRYSTRIEDGRYRVGVEDTPGRTRQVAAGRKHS